MADNKEPGVFDRWRNSDGQTYDGTKMLSDLSGIPHVEVVAMARRAKELRDQGLKGDALREALRREFPPTKPVEPAASKLDDWR